MNGAQGVEALEEVAGGVGVVPVVATVVDHDMKAGLLGEGSGVLREVVAAEQKLEDGIAEGGVKTVISDQGSGISGQETGNR
jgi:hypothetical protein